jgi:AbrB family looped-hinge helix DNA binding protein
LRRFHSDRGAAETFDATGQAWRSQWQNDAMLSSIDSAGRLVIPKPLRERLGLAAGQPLELRERDGLIEIGPAPTPMTLVRRKGGLVAVPSRKLPPLSDEIVRETIERTRR